MALPLARPRHAPCRTRPISGDHKVGQVRKGPHCRVRPLKSHFHTRRQSHRSTLSGIEKIGTLNGIQKIRILSGIQKIGPISQVVVPKFQRTLLRASQNVTITMAFIVCADAGGEVAKAITESKFSLMFLPLAMSSIGEALVLSTKRRPRNAHFSCY